MNDRLTIAAYGSLPRRDFPGAPECSLYSITDADIDRLTGGEWKDADDVMTRMMACKACKADTDAMYHYFVSLLIAGADIGDFTRAEMHRRNNNRRLYYLAMSTGKRGSATIIHRGAKKGGAEPATA